MLSSEQLEIFYVIGIIVTILSTIICPIIAGHKGRSVVGWIFGGLLLGGIGLIIVACLPSLERNGVIIQDTKGNTYFIDEEDLDNIDEIQF